jgi:hypothetical protein
VRRRDHEADPLVGPWLPPDAGTVLTVLALWLAAAYLVGLSGWLATIRPPGPQVVLVGLTVALLAASRLWAPLRRFAGVVDLRALVLFHVTRLIGFYFLALHARGELPRAFALPAGWGDNVVAIGVLLLVPLVRPDTPVGRRLYLAWNVVGLFDILGVVGSAARLALAEPGSMHALLELPLSLLLTFVVPIIIATHVLMLARLTRAAPARRGTSAKDRPG